MSILKKISSDQFIKHNFIFFIGSMLVAFLNYLFHPILGRMMDLQSFGEVQAIISISIILTILTGTFNNIVVNIASHSTEIEKDKDTILMLEKFSFYLISILATLIIIFSTQLKTFFQFDSIYPFIALAILFLTTLSFSFRQALLQGFKDFKSLSLSSVIVSGGRLIFAATLVYFGFSAFGAIIGIVLAQLVALVYLLHKTKQHWSIFDSRNVKITGKIKKELKYGLLLLVSNLCIAFFYSADVILIKHYFSPEIAGTYSGIATIARIIYFTTSSVAGVLLPSIKIGEDKNNKKTLSKAIFLVFSLGLVVLLTFSLFSGIVIRSLVGTKYLVFAPILPKLSLLLFITSLLNLIFSYYQALRRYFLAPISIICPVFVAALSYLRHGSIETVINNFLLGSILIIAFIFLNHVKENIYNHSDFQRRS